MVMASGRGEAKRVSNKCAHLHRARARVRARVRAKGGGERREEETVKTERW